MRDKHAAVVTPALPDGHDLVPTTTSTRRSRPAISSAGERTRCRRTPTGCRGGSTWTTSRTASDFRERPVDDGVLAFEQAPVPKPSNLAARLTWPKSGSGPPRSLVIGDEILSGRTHDKNIAQVASWLQVQGIRLIEVRVVPDVEERIVEAVNALRGRGHDYLFTTGGIGPTHDDITVDAVAKALGVAVVDPPRSAAHPRGLLRDAAAGSPTRACAWRACPKAPTSSPTACRARRGSRSATST